MSRITIMLGLEDNIEDCFAVSPGIKIRFRNTTDHTISLTTQSGFKQLVTVEILSGKRSKKFSLDTDRDTDALYEWEVQGMGPQATRRGTIKVT